MLIKLFKNVELKLYNSSFFKFLTSYTLILTFLILTKTLEINTFAQTNIPENLVSIKLVYPKDTVYAGSEEKIIIKTSIEKGWHINSNKPNEDYLIPSVLEINSQNN